MLLRYSSSVFRQGCKGLHPATLLLFWLSFILLLQAQSTALLMGASFIGIAWFALLRPRFAWLGPLKRLRYLVLSLLLIYAFASPGLLLVPQWGRASPTVEGLRQGGLQVLFLLNMVVSLNILLHYLNRAQLIQGLLFLLAPFRYFGLPVERFALRLSLTLHYAEQLLDQKTASKLTFSAYVSRIFTPPEHLQEQPLAVPPSALGWCDGFCWALLIGLWGMQF